MPVPMGMAVDALKTIQLAGQSSLRLAWSAISASPTRFAWPCACADAIRSPRNRQWCWPGTCVCGVAAADSLRRIRARLGLPAALDLRFSSRTTGCWNGGHHGRVPPAAADCGGTERRCATCSDDTCEPSRGALRPDGAMAPHNAAVGECIGVTKREDISED